MKRLDTLRRWLKNNNLRREALLVSKANELQKYAISAGRIAELKEWFGDDYSKLSFNELFGGSLRTIVPFNTKEQIELLNVVRVLKSDGWEPAGGSNYFDTKSVTQKLRRLNTHEEYEKEVEIADLKVSKQETTVIPAGPRQGEEVVKKKTSSISKVLMNPKSNTPSGLAEWWQNHQTEYAKDWNWKQIESAFNDGEVTTEHSIVISRDPIDVLRMSDHRNITSCHSEGDMYFECAVSESRGNGLVAYLVKTEDLDQLLTPPDPWGFDPNTGKGPNKIDIKDLDLQEIFEDSRRGVQGIKPKSRVRLRKYVNEEADYEFAIPETRSYGPHPPGFIDRVRGWAWETQKDLFPPNSDGEAELPLDSDLKMYGGSYRDSSDGDILNLFFKEGGIDADYLGDVETVSDNEESRFDMWEAEVEEINDRANKSLTYASFYAEVDGEWEGNPNVSSSANLTCTIRLSGWEDPYEEDGNITSDNNKFKDIPTGSWQDREFRGLLEHSEGGDIEEIGLSSEDELEFRIWFSCDDCYNPDDVSEFYDYVEGDIDATYNEHIEKVRRRLVENGYIAEIEFDRAAARLEAMTFRNFNVYGDHDDGDGTVLISTKPYTLLMGGSIDVSKLMASDPHNTPGKRIIMETFNVKAPTAFRQYKLVDEPQVILNALNRIAKESYEETKQQLNFPFVEDAGGEIIDWSKAINNLEVALIEGNNDSIREVSVKVELKILDSDQHILFIEKFISQLDKDIRLIGKYIKQSLVAKLKIAEDKMQASQELFSSGASTRPIIEDLKRSPQPDVKRLALWVEKNWNEFSNAEKEVAYHSFLIPTQRDGDYIHNDDLDAPKFWDSIMQRRPDTDVSYRWSGSSIKDVMPYTDLETPA